jgi:hypothetical protein
MAAAGKARREAFVAARDADALKERVTDDEARKLCLSALRKVYDLRDYLGMAAPNDQLRAAAVDVGGMNRRLGGLLRPCSDDGKRRAKPRPLDGWGDAYRATIRTP